jgi:hypothetical protein
MIVILDDKGAVIFGDKLQEYCVVLQHHAVARQGTSAPPRRRDAKPSLRAMTPGIAAGCARSEEFMNGCGACT